MLNLSIALMVLENIKTSEPANAGILMPLRSSRGILKPPRDCVTATALSVCGCSLQPRHSWGEPLDKSTLDAAVATRLPLSHPHLAGKKEKQCSLSMDNLLEYLKPRKWARWRSWRSWNSRSGCRSRSKWFLDVWFLLHQQGGESWHSVVCETGTKL